MKLAQSDCDDGKKKHKRENNRFGAKPCGVRAAGKSWQPHPINTVLLSNALLAIK
jgi:hypothetical protein